MPLRQKRDEAPNSTLSYSDRNLPQILAAIVTMRDMSAYPEKWQGVNSAEPIYMLYLV